MRESSNSLKLQNFERSFFSLLEFHHSIVNDMDKRKKKTGVIFAQGRDVPRFLFKEVWEIFKKSGISDMESRADMAYNEFLKGHESDVGHYFRNLYRIYKFVDETTLFDNEDYNTKHNKKKQYTGLIRAQLSTYELALLFFNSLHSAGRPFKEYIERYAVFELFRHEFISEDFTMLVNLYKPSAWKAPSSI